LSATAAIIGLSIVLAIELIVATTIPTVVNIHDSYDDMRERSIDRFQTDINITSITTSDNGSNYDLNATVKNIGSTTLKTIDFNILINGSIQDFKCINSFLYPDDKSYFNIYNIPGSGVSRLKVVTNNGIFDYYTYTVI
jgi:archaellum component FlaF (FlaF/FlaG flagellin family)